jgi:hypothetical protein
MPGPNGADHEGTGTFVAALLCAFSAQAARTIGDWSRAQSYVPPAVTGAMFFVF